MKAQTTQPTNLQLHGNTVDVLTCSAAELRISAQQLLHTLDNYMQDAADLHLHRLSNEYSALYYKVENVKHTLNSSPNSSLIGIRSFLKEAWDSIQKPVATAVMVKVSKTVKVQTTTRKRDAKGKFQLPEYLQLLAQAPVADTAAKRAYVKNLRMEGNV